MNNKKLLWSRRHFLSALLGAGASAQAAVVKPDSLIFQEQQKRGFSTLQGLTDETSAQFSLVLPKAGAWSISVFNRAGVSFAIESIERTTREFSDFAAYKVRVHGLSLGETYWLRVTDGLGAIRDEREFTTLDLSPRPVRLAFASCMCDHLHRDDVWNQFARVKPEMAFFLGDSVYADRPGFWSVHQPDPRQLWERYIATRNRVSFYFQKRLIPVLATWDDHDFGGNNVSRDYEHKEESRLLFETFFPQTGAPSVLEGPGIARRFSAFGADFFLLDGRTFRDGWNLQHGRVLGSSQEKWFFPALQAKPTWLLNGSVFYGAYTGKDSFEGQYAGDFKGFIARLRESEATVFFGSGDVHFSEVMDIEAAQLGYKTFEMVSSSMHSYTFPGHHWRFHNSRRRVSTSAHNFTVFEGEFVDRGVRGELASYSASMQEFRTRVEVQR